MIEIGIHLGPYRIQSQIGAGGMGEVYRAIDTRLDRPVAIKILPSHLSSNPDHRQRFEREARAVSSFNHPNICTLHDVGRENGTDFIVMELLEGETLAARLERGPLATPELLRIATEIADALDKAHRQGLVHRDLKPGNVMLTKAGAKLLDFGLARSLAPASVAGGALPPSATMSRPLTAEGTIVGTFQYMAPEQLEGKEADARADIFAFGAVLYEMATGRRAFDGKSQASLIASILREEPRPISEVQPLAPPALERLIRTCLAKDPDDRRQSMHDVWLELRWIAEGGSQAGVPAPVAARRRGRSRLAWMVAAAAGIAAAGFAAAFFMRAPAPPTQVRFSIGAPNGLRGMGSPKISPDGRTLAFSATDTTGKQQLWVRALDSEEPRPLTGTDGAGRPFWSPDSRYLAYFAEGKLKKIAVAGGPAQTVCDAPGGADGSWSRAGTILYDGSVTDSLRKVSASGGVSTAATTIDRASGETGHAWPHFLPDGENFLYIASATSADAGALKIASLDGKESVRIPGAFSRAEYAEPGYLLFVRDGTLMAQAFDPGSKKLGAEPFPVADGVFGETSGNADFSASANGVLAFRGSRGGGTSRIVWFDRSGKELETVGAPGNYSEAIPSPDGTRLAISIGDTRTGTEDIWIRDIARGVTSRFTFDAGIDIWPVWSPDGNWIAFASNRGGAFAVYKKQASGVGNEELLFRAEGQLGPTDWSKDGRTLVLACLTGATRWNLMYGDLSGGPEPKTFLATQFNEAGGRLSPDGRWLAYESNESGRPEIFVQAFPGPGGRWQVSTEGGRFASWHRDGKELVYIARNSRLMSVGVSASEDAFHSSEPRPLFQAPVLVAGNGEQRYAWSADGTRLLFTTPLSREEIPPVRMVLNWTADPEAR